MGSGGDGMSSKLRVAVLVSHPIQYFVPLFRLLAAREELDFRVLYHTRLGTVPYRDEGFAREIHWDIPLMEGYAHEFLSNRFENGGCQWRVATVLLRERPDVLIVHGYSAATNVFGMLVARLLGVRVLMRGDTRVQKVRSSFLRRWLKRQILSLWNGAVATGSANRDYYLSLGMNEGQISFAPFSVDNNVFALPAEHRAEARISLRNELGLPQDSLVVVFASKLLPRKRASDLIEAFSSLCGSIPAAYLVIVGSGDEEERLKLQASAAGEERVHFLGFRNQGELPRIFAAGDAFVLPSENEPWGLVVNEAMASGLPVIVSDDVGAAPDLVANTGAGMVYPCGDIRALAECLATILGNEELRAQMAVRASEVIRSWDVDFTADAIVAAAHQVAGRSRRGPIDPREG